jgi:uncharacterized membrane protein YkoI
MKLDRILSSSLLAGLAVAALPALASATAVPGANVEKSLQAAKITLAQAIATVEKQTSGKITHAAFEEESGKDGYVVTAYTAGKMQTMWVDPQSGAATVVARPSPDEAAVATQDQADLPALNSGKATLSQAVALAEQHDGGYAYDASLQKHNGLIAIDVDVLKNGKLSTVWVDPAAGKIES